MEEKEGEEKKQKTHQKNTHKKKSADQRRAGFLHQHPPPPLPLFFLSGKFRGNENVKKHGRKELSSSSLPSLGLGARPQRPRELQLGELPRPRRLLGHRRLLLRQRQLDVAGGRHVGADAPVRAVSPAALLNGLVDLDVRDVERVDVEPLDLGVGLGVAQQADEQLDRLGRPAALAVVGRRLVLGLRRAADAAAEAAEGDHALLPEDRLEVGLGLGELHLAEGEGGLARVFEVDAEVAGVF